MSRVVYAPEAESDLVEIAEYIANDKPVAARRWVAKIRATCETLASQPQMGELRQSFGIPGCRCFSVGKYVIFFRAAEDGIEVARIIHGSRDMRDL